MQLGVPAAGGGVRRLTGKGDRAMDTEEKLDMSEFTQAALDKLAAERDGLKKPGCYGKVSMEPVYGS